MEEFTVEDAREMSQQLLTEVYAFSLVETGAAMEEEEVLESESDIAENLGK